MQIGQRFVADALAVEEACASAVLSVAVNSDGSVSKNSLPLQHIGSSNFSIAIFRWVGRSTG
jgi:hypothetical protein